MDETRPDAIPSPPGFSTRERWILFAIMLLGTALRLAYQGDRPFVGDEVGTLIHIQKPYGDLLTRVETWLTMNWFLALEKLFVELFGSHPWVLVALPLAAGLATVPLTALVAREWLPPGPSLGAALLVAVNPYLVYQSLNIRSYSLLVALSLLLVLAYREWTRRADWTRGTFFALVLVVLVLLHPNGVYPGIVLALVASRSLVADFQSTTDERARLEVIRRYGSLGAPCLFACVALFTAYQPIWSQLVEHGHFTHDTPPTGLEYLSFVLASYLGPGFWSWPVGAMVLLGIRRSMGRDEERSLLPLVLLPPLLLSLQGVSHFPWGFARYLIFTLPFLLILAGVGIAALPRIGASLPGSLGIALLLGATMTPGLKLQFEKKWNEPWDEVKRYLTQQISKGDFVVVLGFTARHQLDSRYQPDPYELFGPEIFLPTFDPGIPTEGRRAFLVLPGLESGLRPGAQQFGTIGVIPFPASDLQELRVLVRADLLQRVSGSWPTDPEFAEVYAALVQADALPNIPGADSRLRELESAALARSRWAQWSTPTMRRLAGEAVSARWKGK